MAAALCSNDAQTKLFEELKALIEASHSIALAAHTSPDGDAIGSTLALSALIQQIWPEKEVSSILADADDLPAMYHFLAGSEAYLHAAEYTANPDLFICVDLAPGYRLAEAEAIYERADHVAIIDHHPRTEPVGDVWICRTDAAATGVIICEFALWLGVELTPEIAQLLLCAIVTDTGRFQFQNTDGEAFKIASILMDRGADPAQISLEIYQSYSLPYLHLQSIVMSRLTTLFEGRVAYSWARMADFDATGARIEECEGLIDIVRSLGGPEIALFLRETRVGKIRGNLRAKGDMDISEVARALGGGGHKAAAGFSLECTLDEAYEQVLPLLEKLLAH